MKIISKEIISASMFRIILYYIIFYGGVIGIYYAKGIDNLLLLFVVIFFMALTQIKYIVKSVEITEDFVKFNFLLSNLVLKNSDIKSVKKTWFRTEIRVYFCDGSNKNLIAGFIFRRNDIHKIIKGLSKQIKGVK